MAKKQIRDLLTAGESTSSNRVIATKLIPKEAIDCLSRGIEINLSLYKGKEEKLQLVDEAVNRNDGNAIITTVLHLNRTIKPSIFNYELSKRSVAADHYIFYLKENQRTDQLIDTLSMLGRHEEAAITAYNQAISCSNVDTKIHNLKNCLRNHFSTGGNEISFWRDLIAEQISLLEQQLPIEADDKRQELNALNPLFLEIPRKPLPDCSVISTLHYCCLYHYSLPENHLASPKAICKTYQLNQKQFVWTALNAMASAKRWTEIDTLFEYKVKYYFRNSILICFSKSWLGNRRMKSFIAFDKVLSILYKNDAPRELLEKYLFLIDDFDIRFESAKDVKLVKTVIDVSLILI